MKVLRTEDEYLTGALASSIHCSPLHSWGFPKVLQEAESYRHVWAVCLDWPSFSLLLHIHYPLEDLDWICCFPVLWCLPSSYWRFISQRVSLSRLIWYYIDYFNLFQMFRCHMVWEAVLGQHLRGADHSFSSVVGLLRWLYRPVTSSHCASGFPIFKGRIVNTVCCLLFCAVKMCLSNTKEVEKA